MSKRGYKSEYQAKTILEGIYGKGNVIKTTASQYIPDFIVIQRLGEAWDKSWHVTGIEVKSTTKKKYQPSSRDRKQMLEFKKWSQKTGVKVVYWIVLRKRPKNTIEKLNIYDYAIKYGGKQ